MEHPILKACQNLKNAFFLNETNVKTRETKTKFICKNFGAKK
jgi:hypothetical protein